VTFFALRCKKQAVLPIDINNADRFGLLLDRPCYRAAHITIARVLQRKAGGVAARQRNAQASFVDNAAVLPIGQSYYFSKRATI